MHSFAGEPLLGQTKKMSTRRARSHAQPRERALAGKVRCNRILERLRHTYVSIRQHTSAYVSIRQHTSAYVSIRQHTSAYVSIRQHTSAYVSVCVTSCEALLAKCVVTRNLGRLRHTYVSRRQQTSANVCRRQQTSADVNVCVSGSEALLA
jgi:hypothetical protein